jgi:glycosyltransferase involved in cell wall biosynthesis
MSQNVDVIIPVGPGHADLFNRAVESVSIASNFSGVEARIIRVADTDGLLGRSLARNHGVQRAEAEWLFFLDADDLMHPRALTVDLNTGRDAVFGAICELVGGNVVERYQVPAIDTYEQLIAHDPFITIQMGHFVKREAALQLPFNLDMDCGEDWEYYLKLWQGYACEKIDKPLMINCRGQHSTGPRSATGADWSRVVGEMITKARDGLNG